MATIISFNRRRTQATKVAWVVVPPLDESTGLPDLPLFSREVGGALSMNGLASRLLELRPESATFWIDRIESIDRAAIEETFARMPDGWMSDDRAAFTIDLLVTSRDRLVLLASGRSQTQTQPQR
jgi:hypothetical protein